MKIVAIIEYGVISFTLHHYGMTILTPGFWIVIVSVGVIDWMSAMDASK